MNYAPTVQEVFIISRLNGLMLAAITSIILVVMIAMADLTVEYKQRIASLENHLLQFSLVLSEHAERSLESVAIAVSLTAEEMEGRAGWTALPELELHHLLRGHHIEALPQSRELILFDNEGRQRARSHRFPTNSISTVIDRPYFQSNKAGSYLVFSPPFQGRNTGNWTFAVTYRIDNLDEGFDGLVFSAIEPAYFRKLHQRISPFKHYTALLIYQDDRIMMSTDDEDDSSSALWTGRKYEDHPAWSAVSHQNEEGGLEHHNGWIRSIVDIPDSPFRLAVAIHNDEIADSWFKYVLKTVLSAGIIITLIFVLELVARNKIQRSEGKYRLLFTEMLSGFALHKVILDETGEVVDYRYTEANPAFRRLTGISNLDLIGMTTRELPPHIEDGWIKRLGIVGTTGKPDHFISFNGYQNRYFEAYAFCPRIGEVGVTFTDVTDRIHAEAALQDALQTAKEANIKLEKLSVTDGLTGLNNRRRFDEMLSLACYRAGRAQSPLTLLMIDIDFFKQFNDVNGHQKGDYCLQEVAKVLELHAKRIEDTAARYGGEEFAVILPGADCSDGLNIAQKIRLSVESLQIPNGKNNVVTVSIGLATVRTDKSLDAKDVIAEADKALYEAKSSGRNRVEISNT